MPPPPLVTVVTPNLNGGRFLGQAIASVAAQEGVRVEHIVVDGGSTDDSRDILEAREDKLAWFVEPGSGQAAAIAAGFARASGDYLTWLNADDLYRPGALAAMVAALTEAPDAALVYGDADFVDADGGFIRAAAHVEDFSYRRLLHDLDFIVQPASLFRRDAYEAVGGLDQRLHYAMDYDLWLKLGARYRVVRLPRTLAAYRLHGAGKTETAGFARIAEVERVARRHGGPGLPSNFVIEKAALHWHERSLRGAAMTAATLLAAPGALRELASRRFWRVWRAGRQAGAA
ncbi:MAG: glycosyltransferase family 2 protein [Alphaproteobacteria bacterium]